MNEQYEYAKAINYEPYVILNFLMIATKAEKKIALGLLQDLEPETKIQYVRLDAPQLTIDKMVKCGVIKPTKKGGHYTYIIPKDVAFSSLEPRLKQQQAHTIKDSNESPVSDHELDYLAEILDTKVKEHLAYIGEPAIDLSISIDVFGNDVRNPNDPIIKDHMTIQHLIDLGVIPDDWRGSNTVYVQSKWANESGLVIKQPPLFILISDNSSGKKPIPNFFSTVRERRVNIVVDA